MTALITVICLALLIYCLVEREVRNAIAPATTLPGLGAGHPAKPTGAADGVGSGRLSCAGCRRPP
jgi:hypothetical protein